MARHPTDGPTDAQLEILNVLWERGPSTVREVFEALDERRGYTTVLKLMQIMTEKGLLSRDDSRRTHVFQPSSPPATTKGQLVRSLINKAFGGSASELIMHALSERPTSAAELDEVRRLLATLDGEEG